MVWEGLSCSGHHRDEEWRELMCLRSLSSTVPSSYTLEGGDAGLVILKKRWQLWR